MLIIIPYLIPYTEISKERNENGYYDTADGVDAGADLDVGFKLLPKLIDQNELFAAEDITTFDRQFPRYAICIVYIYDLFVHYQLKNIFIYDIIN